MGEAEGDSGARVWTENETIGENRPSVRAQGELQTSASRAEGDGGSGGRVEGEDALAMVRAGLRSRRWWRCDEEAREEVDGGGRRS